VKRPKTVTFGATEWDIEFVGDLGDLAGQTLKVQHRILVRDGIEDDPASVRSTLLHEVLHAALHGTGLSTLSGWTDEIEESLVASLEGPLMEFLKRPANARALQWVQS
jgi:hypothetical protein